MNQCIMMGRLTRDPELKTTQSGVNVCSFSVAVARRFDRNATDFINVVAWKQTGEFVSRYFRKGQMIAFTGSLQTRQYEDRNRQKRTAYEIVADAVYFCGKEAPTTENNENNDLHTEGLNAQEKKAVQAHFNGDTSHDEAYYNALEKAADNAQGTFESFPDNDDLPF